MTDSIKVDHRYSLPFLMSNYSLDLHYFFIYMFTVMTNNILKLFQIIEKNKNVFRAKRAIILTENDFLHIMRLFPWSKTMTSITQ
jgi:hypothetical protein